MSKWTQFNEQINQIVDMFGDCYFKLLVMGNVCAKIRDFLLISRMYQTLMLWKGMIIVLKHCNVSVNWYLLRVRISLFE